MTKDEALEVIKEYGEDAEVVAAGCVRRRKPTTKLIGLAKLLIAGHRVYCIGFSTNALRIHEYKTSYVLPWHYLEVAAEPKKDLGKLIKYVKEHQRDLILLGY